MATRRETAKAGAAMGNGPAKATASRARKEARPRGRRPFAGVPEIRSFFRTNQTPVYFVSPTPFNLLGMDRWARNFHYVNYYDSFDGGHPRVFVPGSGNSGSGSRWKRSTTTCSA